MALEWIGSDARHRLAQFKRVRLLERFGPDKPIPTMLRGLKACDVGNSLSGPQCQLRYWDSMTPERRSEAMAKDGLPESWTNFHSGEFGPIPARQKLLIEHSSTMARPRSC